jgi:MipA family protein
MVRFKLLGKLIGGLALSLGLSAPVLGADLGTSVPVLATPAADGWIVTLGVGPEVAPSFPGAKTYRVYPLPLFAWHRANEPMPFSAPDDGFDVALLDLGWIKAGPVARIVPNRGLSNGNGNFVGLPNVGWTGEIGGFLEVWPWEQHLRTRLELRQSVNGNHGLDANVAIDAVAKWGAATFSIGPRMALGNSTYMNAYFSVTPAQAFANGTITPYQAYGGVTSFGGLASVKYDFTPAWSATLFGGYDRFVNSAAQSPITNKLGSLNQFSGGVILAYSFSLSALGF